VVVGVVVGVVVVIGVTVVDIPSLVAARVSDPDAPSESAALGPHARSADPPRMARRRLRGFIGARIDQKRP
jgi:hypothetical protein